MWTSYVLPSIKRCEDEDGGHWLIRIPIIWVCLLALALGLLLPKLNWSWVTEPIHKPALQQNVAMAVYGWT